MVAILSHTIFDKIGKYAYHNEIFEMITFTGGFSLIVKNTTKIQIFLFTTKTYMYACIQFMTYSE